MNQSTRTSQNSTGLTIFTSLHIRDAVLLFLILGAGLAARELFVALSDHRIASDETEYHSLATTLVKEGVYAVNGRPTAYRPVGYPLFVASIYALAGFSPIAVKIVQAFLDAMIGMILFFIASSSHSKRSGFLAAGIWMVFLPAVLYANRLFSETLFTFLLVVTAFLAVSSNPLSLLRWMILSFLFALLTLIKPWMILFVAFWYVYSFRKRRRMKEVAVSAVFFLCLLAPWVVRNTIEFGVPTLSLNGGMNLYIGHNPESTGGYKGVFPAELTSNPHDEVALDRKARAMALAHIKKHPEQLLTNGIKKVGHLFASEGELLVFTLSERDPSSPQRYAQEYVNLPIPLILATNIPYILVLLVGMAGLVVSRKKPLWYFAVGIILTTVLVSVVFFGGSRFHFPFMPFMTIFASGLLTKGISNWRELTRAQCGVIVFLTIAFCSIWFYEIVVLASV